MAVNGEAALTVDDRQEIISNKELASKTAHKKVALITGITGQVSIHGGYCTVYTRRQLIGMLVTKWHEVRYDTLQYTKLSMSRK